MGYDTHFTGRIRFDRPLTPKQVEAIKDFCGERHDTGQGLELEDGCPGIWCSWDTDGQSVFWDGSEKSYDMAEWLGVLIERFFRPYGVVLHGRILAEGARHSDRWTITVKDNEIVEEQIDIAAVLGITK